MFGFYLQFVGIGLGVAQLGSASLDENLNSEEMNRNTDGDEQRNEQVRPVVLLLISSRRLVVLRSAYGPIISS